VSILPLREENKMGIAHIPLGEELIKLDRTGESADSFKYAILYKKGYSKEEASKIMDKIRKGVEYISVEDVPRKKRR